MACRTGHRRLYLDECGWLRPCIVAHVPTIREADGTVLIRDEMDPAGLLRKTSDTALFEYRRRLANRPLRRPRPTGEDFVQPPEPIREPARYPPLTGLAPTPFNPSAFEEGLQDHPNRSFVKFIVSGLKEGIDTFTTVKGNGKPVRNLRSGAEFPDKVAEFLRTEEAAGRYYRIPATPAPRPDLHFSPLGTAPKRSYEVGVVKRRVISHHSAGPNRGEKAGSVNGEMSMRHLAVEFQTVLDVMDYVRQVGPDARLSKTDIRSAYRNLPVRPDLQHTQCSEWQGVLRADLCLSFGTASGPWTFEQFACAVHYILQKDLNRELGQEAVKVFHYLDDCLLVGRDETESEQGFKVMLKTYSRLGIPLSEEKTEAALPRAEFLGLIVDAENQCLLYPEDKQADLLRILRQIEEAGKSNRRVLRSLLGKLTFAHAVFPLVRPFVTELYRLTNKLKEDAHFVRLSGVARTDIEIWRKAITNNKGTPFKNRERVANRDDAIKKGHWACGDASGEIGYGWYDQSSYTIVRWNPQERASFSTRGFANSSTWQETTALVAATLTWLEKGHRGQVFVYYSDANNLRLNHDSGRSTNSAVNNLLRLLASHLMARDCRLEVVWQPRSHPMQEAADYLSRADPRGFTRARHGHGRLRRKTLTKACLRHIRGVANLTERVSHDY